VSDASQAKAKYRHSILILSLKPSDALILELEGVYKDLHAHPELSMQE
jgi:hypothetical protein